MSESPNTVIGGTAVPETAWQTGVSTEIGRIEINTRAKEILLPISDSETMSGWTASDSGTTAWNLLDSGVDTPALADYVTTSSADIEFVLLGISSPARQRTTQIKIRCLLETSDYSARFWQIFLYNASYETLYENYSVYLSASNAAEIKEFVLTGEWTEADLTGMELRIAVIGDAAASTAKIYEAEVQVF